MANPFLVPIISKIHWDDIEGLFTLKITFMVKSAAGNFNKEVVVTAATLADIFTQILQIWAGTTAAGPATQIPFHLGDMAALGASIAAWDAPDFAALVVPEPSSDATPFDPAYTYDGVADSWGVTPP